MDIAQKLKSNTRGSGYEYDTSTHICSTRAKDAGRRTGQTYLRYIYPYL